MKQKIDLLLMMETINFPQNPEILESDFLCYLNFFRVYFQEVKAMKSRHRHTLVVMIFSELGF